VPYSRDYIVKLVADVKKREEAGVKLEDPDESDSTNAVSFSAEGDRGGGGGRSIAYKEYWQACQRQDSYHHNTEGHRGVARCRNLGGVSVYSLTRNQWPWIRVEGG